MHPIMQAAKAASIAAVPLAFLVWAKNLIIVIMVITMAPKQIDPK
jgi:hypothetical protein